SRLLDGPNMSTVSSAVWHTMPEFPPYHFFNVSRGQENVGRGKSIYNVAEADAAVALVDMLCTRFPTIKFASKIGVITPYKQQVSQLKSCFRNRFGNGIIDVIDFNTVDGFQGQEKEIIIFSCVRAGSGRGIGFLADVRRMNVGLTRAKCSLFVLGNARSLSNSEYWGDLVRDASHRKLMTECKYPYFGHRMENTSIPSNIFEKDIVITKKRTLPQKKGPIKIARPKSLPDDMGSETETVGEKRKASPVLELLHSKKRGTIDEDVVMEDKSFIDKVRMEKKAAGRGVPIVAPSNSMQKKKVSMAEYNSMRGNDNHNNKSSLFINRKRPGVQKSRHEQHRNWPESISAREKAMMDANKDRMRRYREEERRRDNSSSSSRRDPVRNINSLVNDAQNRYSRDSRHF
ncbi:DEAD-box type RNA helicase, partial [Rhizopus stolonifer]